MNTYRLLKRHIVRGIELPAGSIVALDDRQAAWLAEQGVIATNRIAAPAAPLMKPVRRVGGCAGCGR